MVSAFICLLALLMPAQSSSLELRFIGNMAVSITDGVSTIVMDFPYESGYSSYMTYDSSEIRSSTAATLALITHRHRDHWEPDLFAKTGWNVAGPPDVIAGVAESRVLRLTASSTTFGAASIQRIPTPHARIGHFSYVVTWQGRRLFFSGDTESIGPLLELRDLDVAFVSPWLYRAVLAAGRRIDAKQIVIYHHQAGEKVPECAAACLLPSQGQSIPLR